MPIREVNSGGEKMNKYEQYLSAQNQGEDLRYRIVGKYPCGDVLIEYPYGSHPSCYYGFTSVYPISSDLRYWRVDEIGSTTRGDEDPLDTPITSADCYE